MKKRDNEELEVKKTEDYNSVSKAKEGVNDYESGCKGFPTSDDCMRICENLPVYSDKTHTNPFCLQTTKNRE